MSKSCISLFTMLFTFTLFLYHAIQTNPIDQSILLYGVILVILEALITSTLRTVKPKADTLIINLVLLLLSVGCDTLLLVNQPLAAKQLMFSILGIATIAIIVSWNNLKLRILSLDKFLAVISLILFVLPMTPLGSTVAGGNNWIQMGSVSFQPSELGKITIILYIAVVCSSHSRTSILEDIKMLALPLTIVGISILLLMKQNDLGTALILSILTIVLIYVATNKVTYPIVAILFASLLFITISKYYPHLQNRLEAWRDPWSNYTTTGYQICEGLYAISSGGYLGNPIEDVRYMDVSVCESDYIYTVICEEHGVYFSILLVLLYTILFLRCCYFSAVAKDKFSGLVILGISANLVLNVLILLGGIYNLIPLTGLPLPFVSAGGSSLLVSFLGIGLIMNLSEVRE